MANSRDRSDPQEIAESTSKPTSKPVIIFTWNPDWEIVKKLDLNKRIELFKEFIIFSQEEFKHHPETSDGICLMVAPDLIFSLGSPTSLYTHDIFTNFCKQIELLQQDLKANSLVIGGAIDYVDESGKYYKVTSPIISSSQINFYDKKASAGDRIHAGKTLTMQPGLIDGYYTEFQGVPIGLEICQDHDQSLLKKSLAKSSKTVSVQVLISHGQCRRDYSIVTPGSNRKNTFVHVELEPGAINYEKRTLESANYEVELKVETPKSAQTYHQRTLNKSIKPLNLTRLKTMTLQTDEPLLGDIRHCTVQAKLASKHLATQKDFTSTASLSLHLKVLDTEDSKQTSIGSPVSTASDLSLSPRTPYQSPFPFNPLSRDRSDPPPLSIGTSADGDRPPLTLDLPNTPSQSPLRIITPNHDRSDPPPLSIGPASGDATSKSSTASEPTPDPSDESSVTMSISSTQQEQSTILRAPEKTKDNRTRRNFLDKLSTARKAVNEPAFTTGPQIIKDYFSEDKGKEMKITKKR